jgi:geranylgeranyl diphosphate synthase type II
VNVSTERAASSPGVPVGLEWYAGALARVNAAITTHLKKLETSLGTHSRLGEAVRYSVALPGKRFRPVLLMECCRCCGGVEVVALTAGIAVECVHAFSLIHDDLPAMDDDDLRRGQPSNHKVFGEAMAILAGDWLATHAFALLLEAYPAELAASLGQALAAGALGMVEGQGADVDGEERPTDATLVEYIHLHKTARLIEATCRMGALCAGADAAAREAVSDYGRHLGLAFQITDDLLDVTGSTAALGKQVGKDAAAAKQTYPAAHGTEASRRRAHEEVAAALAAVDMFGERADRLREMARYVIARDH